MDEAVTARAGAALLLLTAALGGPATGQALTDPTRPPPSLLVVVPGGVAMPAVPAEPQLQSVLVSTRAGGRRVAVIDGQSLRVGEEFGGAVLSRITETEVELRRGSGRQVLRLFPAADLKAAPNGASQRP